MAEFRNTMDFNKRLLLSQKIMTQHPNSVPVILKSDNKIELAKTKFILAKELSVGSFIQQIRNNTTGKLDSSETIFLFCDRSFLIPTSQNFGNIYQKYKNDDGFLYLTVMKENTFGF